MKKEGIRKVNIRNVLVGFFFGALSNTIFSFFLPFFLKEKGLTIIEIGALFTIGLAIGTFFFSVGYSAFVRKTKLKTGLSLSVFFGFLQNFLIFIFPTTFFISASKFVNEMKKSTSQISNDVAIQHNMPKGKYRGVGSYLLIMDALGILIGIALSYLLIESIGFKYSFLVFALLVLPSFYFYSKVDDRTRFKYKKQVKLPKTSFKLKLVLFAELIYWLAMGASFALVITFLVTDYFSSSMFWIGALFFGLYTSIVITTLFTRKYLNRFNLFKTSIFGMCILFVSSLVVIFSKDLYAVLFAMVLEGIGASIWVPSKMAVYWKLTGKESREKVSGYLFGWKGIASALGPLIGGFLVISMGMLAPFYFKAIITAFIILIYFYIFRKG